MRRTTWAARLGVIFAALALLGVFVPSALAQEEPGGQGGHGVGGEGGLSTPGVIVTAQNPGTSRIPRVSDLRMTLTAHSDRSSVENPDCRPAEGTRPPPTLRCWGSLVLHVPADSPEAAGLTVTGFQEVHKVSVGETSCGDDHDGDCDEGGGCEAGGSCEEGGTATMATNPAEFDQDQVQVNGIAVVTAPGTTNLPVGTQMQVKITLADYGTAQYQDTAYVVINKFANGANKPTVYTSAEAQTIQQVRIQYLGNISG